MLGSGIVAALVLDGLLPSGPCSVLTASAVLEACAGAPIRSATSSSSSSRPCAAHRTARPGCAAAPAARPPPRTTLAAAPGKAGDADPAAPSLPVRRRQADQSGGQLHPQLRVAQPREQPQCEHEVHPDPGR